MTCVVITVCGVGGAGTNGSDKLYLFAKENEAYDEDETKKTILLIF
jgi:hypothetical protein